ESVASTDAHCDQRCCDTHRGGADRARRSPDGGRVEARESCGRTRASSYSPHRATANPREAAPRARDADPCITPSAPRAQLASVTAASESPAAREAASV